MVRAERDVDWGCAEALALASLVSSGVPVRFAGQDSRARHLQPPPRGHPRVRTTAPSTSRWPTWPRRPRRASRFGTRCSPKKPRWPSSTATLSRADDAFVVWEAQFGDFANGAQIPIDQFIVSGEAKWRQTSGVTLLLPHGFDGQGPEHSSARPERFLAACSGGNMTVCNCTTAAQYFHLLRRQGEAAVKRPLIVLTPKSLLRDPRAASPIGDLVEGRFQELIPDAQVDPTRAKRLVFCSGKIYHELAKQRAEQGVEDVALTRLEQYYPLPQEAIEAELARFEGCEVVWCQEEPRNMGAWPFVLQRFVDMGRTPRYIGRPESSSPATGSYRRHEFEQARVVERALTASSESDR